jgi:hypothetical protein
MIIGFNFRKIDVNRENVLKNNIKITYNMDMTKVYEQPLPLSSKQKGLGFDFEFTVDYNPDKMANVLIKGTVNYMADEELFKKILSNWKDSKKLPKEVSIPIINLILNKCNVKALELEQDFGLPAHLPMPKVKVPSENVAKNEKYIG